MEEVVEFIDSLTGDDASEKGMKLFEVIYGHSILLFYDYAPTKEGARRRILCVFIEWLLRHVEDDEFVAWLQMRGYL